jgi:MinD-like ATPase involved in chromosome partitioning or flagellar assembly
VNPYRTLALRLIHDLPPETERTVLLTEPSGNGLAGTVALWVAKALATEANRPVLAVDAAAAFSEVSASAGCGEVAGFSDFVALPDQTWESSVLETDSELVSMLPAGQSSAGSLAFPEAKVARFLTEAATRYGFVVLAGGPVLEDSLPIRLASLVECVLLVAREDSTLRRELESAQEAISLSKARRAGVVLVKGGPAPKRIWSRR